MNRIIIFGILLLVMMSCGDNSNLAPSSEMADHFYELGNRGWKSKKVTHFTGQMQYRATQVPLEYYLLKNKEVTNFDEIDSLAQGFSNERIIEFEFEHSLEKDLLESEFTNLDYDASVIYMANTIKKDFLAVTSSNDTISCAGVLLERNFKVAPFKRVLLYFGNIPPDENIQLIYNDTLFNNGTFKFKFSEIPFKI